MLADTTKYKIFKDKCSATWELMTKLSSFGYR